MEPERDPRLYVGIRAQLARKIRDGEFPVGPKLPTEKELAGPVRLRDQRRPEGAPAARSGRTDGPEDSRKRLFLPRRLGAPHPVTCATPGIPGRVSDMVAKRLLSSVALARARAGPATTLPVVEGPEE